MGKLPFLSFAAATVMRHGSYSLMSMAVAGRRGLWWLGGSAGRCPNLRCPALAPLHVPVVRRDGHLSKSVTVAGAWRSVGPSVSQGHISGSSILASFFFFVPMHALRPIITLG